MPGRGAALPRQASCARLELNLPNLITLARLLSVPLAIWLILGERYGARLLGLRRRRRLRRARRLYRQALRPPHPARRRARPGRRQGAADRRLRHAGVAGHLPGWLVVPGRPARRADRAAATSSSGRPRRRSRSDPLFISKINTLVQIALVGFVLARLGLGVEAGVATALLDRRRGGHDGAVGLVLSGALGAASSSGAEQPS